MTWLAMLAENAWKATIILGAAAAANWALRRSPSALRHVVWTAAFVGLLTLPLLTLEMPRRASLALPVAPGVPAVTVLHVTPAPAHPPRDWSVLPLIWLAGCLGVLAWFLIGTARTAWLVRRSTEARCDAQGRDLARDLGIRRGVRVLACPGIPMPLTWGVLRPVLLLPPDAIQWPAARLRAALLHELVHVRRMDVLWQALAQAACCLYWFHPVVWFGLSRFRKERERACDDAVLLGGMPAHEYAGHLMDLVRLMRAKRASLAGAPAMAEMSDFESRVRALLDRRRNRGPVSRRAAVAVAAAVIAVILPIASVKAQPQARGALAGIVQDASGARVPGCEVTATNLDGTNREVTRTNPAGEYTFAAIPPGKYALEFRMRGFALLKTEATVSAGVPTRADGALQLGSVSESVRIRGQKPAAAAPASPMGTRERIRVGGNVQATKIIFQVRPDYPADLQAAGVQGTVVLRAVISTTGDLLNLQAINTDVHPGLVKAALDAVRLWRYQPTLLNGEPVEVSTTITIDFSLE